MRARRWIASVVALIAVVALGAVAATAMQQGGKQEEPERTYRVTPWPGNTASEDYHELLEKYLNQMAAQGWRLQVELSAQGTRMLVFERRGR